MYTRMSFFRGVVVSHFFVLLTGFASKHRTCATNTIGEKLKAHDAMAQFPPPTFSLPATTPCDMRRHDKTPNRNFQNLRRISGVGMFSADCPCSICCFWRLCLLFFLAIIGLFVLAICRLLPPHA